VHQDGRAAELRPGQMCLLEPSRPFVVDVRHAKHAVLHMPRSQLEQRIGDVRPVTARVLSTASSEGRLTAGIVRTLLKSNLADANALDGLAVQAVDVAALAATGGAPETVKRLSSPVAVSRLRLHHAIEDCFSRRDYDVAGMAGMSARYANMLLSQEGTTLERQIVLRRLERCRAALCDQQHLAEGIGDIALSFGFASASHFARRFKDAYGITASEYRAIAGDPTQVDLLESAIAAHMNLATR
jgi:AraC family transcriptional activator of tynA and feaB